MLGGELVIGADDRTFEQRPRRLGRVGVNITANPLLGVVIDGGVNGAG